MNTFSNEIVYASIGLLIGSFIYLKLQERITSRLYLYLTYILLFSIAIFFAISSISYYLENILSLESLFYFFLIYTITCFTSIIYILEKQFQCTAWFPRILFILLILSLYYLPYLLGVFLTIAVFDLH